MERILMARWFNINAVYYFNKKNNSPFKKNKLQNLEGYCLETSQLQSSTVENRRLKRSSVWKKLNFYAFGSCDRGVGGKLDVFSRTVLHFLMKEPRHLKADVSFGYSLCILLYYNTTNQTVVSLPDVPYNKPSSRRENKGISWQCSLIFAVFTM